MHSFAILAIRATGCSDDAAILLGMTPVSLEFRAIDEPQPGARWRQRFNASWPLYREWFLRDGEAARASYAEARRMLRSHMPELVPVWEWLVELAGGSDLAARCLAMYDTPPLSPGCSQAVYDRGEPILVRNYDFHPDRFEGVIAGTALTGRRVVGTSDCMWGLLDGLNDDGLAASITFGGEARSERGFAIPIVVRYLLEMCDSVPAAVAALADMPIQAPYNLTLLDRAGRRQTLFLRPGSGPREAQFVAATNHQATVACSEYAEATRTVERQRLLLDLIADDTVDEEQFISSFLRPPLRSTDYPRGFGTLYTAVLRPSRGTAEYRWPNLSWQHSVAQVHEGIRSITLETASAAERPAVDRALV
jgi:predicted choloylglycine hydrolase